MHTWLLTLQFVTACTDYLQFVFLSKLALAMTQFAHDHAKVKHESAACHCPPSNCDTKESVTRS